MLPTQVFQNVRIRNAAPARPCGWHSRHFACQNREALLQTPSVVPPHPNCRATHAGNAPRRRRRASQNVPIRHDALLQSPLAPLGPPEPPLASLSLGVTINGSSKDSGT